MGGGGGGGDPGGAGRPEEGKLGEINFRKITSLKTANLRQNDRTHTLYLVSQSNDYDQM